MKVGFIGLGLMGSGMAKNIQNAGYELNVHDVRREAAEPFLKEGATWAESPAAVARNSEVIFTSLPGPPEVEQVVFGDDGLLHGLNRGSTYFDVSSNSPTLVRQINHRLEEVGCYMLDAPVSGGPSGAAAGTLALWIGGDEDAFHRHEEILNVIGDKNRIEYVGPSGSGAIVKLCHNLAGYAVNTVLAEVITLGVKAGLDPLVLWSNMRKGANGRARTFDMIAGHFLQNRYDPPNFALKLAHKDVGLATALGKELGVPMRLSNLTLEEMTEALGRGWAGRDSRVALSLQRERAGVDIEVEGADIRAVRDADHPAE